MEQARHWRNQGVHYPANSTSCSMGSTPIRAGIREDAHTSVVPNLWCPSALLTCQGTGTEVGMFLQGVCHDAVSYGQKCHTLH